jgi:predicted nucleic acid-binding Zn ribbon protein
MFKGVRPMYCQKCGKTIPDDAQFCPDCGEVPYGESKKTKVRTSEVEVFVDEVDEEIARRKKAVPLYIVLIVLGCVVSTVTIFRTLTNFISTGDVFYFNLSYSMITTPSILLAAWGVVGLAIAGNRKIAMRTLQKKKKIAEERRSRFNKHP